MENSEQPAVAAPTPEKKENKNTPFIIGIVICLILAACGAGFGIFEMSKVSDAEKKAEIAEKKVSELQKELDELEKAEDDCAYIEDDRYLTIVDWGIKIKVSDDLNIEAEYDDETAIVHANFSDDEELIERLGENPLGATISRSKTAPADTSKALGVVQFGGYYYVISGQSGVALTDATEEEMKSLSDAYEEMIKALTNEKNYEKM